MKLIPRPDIKKYELAEDMAFWIGKDRYVIPAGFCFDGASIPKLFWSIVTSPYQPDVIKAACVHDYLYRTNLVARDIADDYFKLGLILDGVDEQTAETMFAAVRVAGSSAFKHGPDNPVIGV